MNSNFKQSNKDKEIINRTLIISYFLIFLLVFILLFMIKETFFKYTANEAVSYSNYSGSVHVGIDTKPGDYYIENTSGLSSDYVYGVKTDKNSDFSVMAYSDNQILQLKKGEHLILYKANLTPVDEEIHNVITSELDAAIENEINDTMASDQMVLEDKSDAVVTDTDGMIKLSNQYYNIPYIFVAAGENPYIELYDKDVNVLSFEVIDSEHIYSIAPTEASYLKLNDVKVYSFSQYVSSGRNVNGTFSDGVYIVGRGIESGEFILEQEASECQYRVIDGEETVGATAMLSCDALPQILDLNEGQIIEFHGAKLSLYSSYSG